MRAGASRGVDPPRPGGVRDGHRGQWGDCAALVAVAGRALAMDPGPGGPGPASQLTSRAELLPARAARAGVSLELIAHVNWVYTARRSRSLRGLRGHFSGSCRLVARAWRPLAGVPWRRGRTTRHARRGASRRAQRRGACASTSGAPLGVAGAVVAAERRCRGRGLRGTRCGACGGRGCGRSQRQRGGSDRGFLFRRPRDDARGGGRRARVLRSADLGAR